MKIFFLGEGKEKKNPPMHRGAIHKTEVGRTTLTSVDGTRLPFHGLFATEAIQRGDFVGFYCGDFYDEDDEEVPTSAYAMNGSGFLVVPPTIDPVWYPMAMVNEPPLGASANVCLLEWAKAGEVDPDWPKKTDPVQCLSFHATRTIRAGEEIFLHYGPEYDRSHYPAKGKLVGSPSRLAKKDVDKTQRPSFYYHALREYGVHVPDDAFR